MATPTVLIFTANDQNGSLTTLSVEGKTIQRTLNSTTGRTFETVLVPDATIDDVIQEFNVPDREIEILHYAGHAGDQAWKFKDDLVEANNLAAKIKARRTVKLVFLNGCATIDQVDFFHEAGVPFIVATSKPVEDENATWLATQFYQYLTLKRSLKKAMEEVEVDAKMLAKKIIIGNERGVVNRIKKKDENESFVWGLYIKPELTDQDYRLPVSNIGQFDTREIVHTLFLDQLIFALDASSNDNLPGIRDVASKIQKGFKITDRKKANELLKVLPYTLGIRLRQIVAEPDDRSYDYYRQLLFDYVIFCETLLHHCLSVLLAQLWQDELHAFKHKPENVNLIWSFLKENRMTEPLHKYVPLINLLGKWVDAYNPQSEISIGAELVNYLQSEAFEKISNFLFLQKQYFLQQVRLDESEMIENCFIAQKYINECFPFFIFILKFTFASVREINVMNFRHLPEDFENIENVVSKLVVNEIDPSPITGNLDLNNMMENKTVLSFFEAEPEIGNKSLNLFPFIIDRNVFAGEPNTEVDLYLFIGYFNSFPGQPPSYHFASVNNPQKIWQFDDQNLQEVSFLHVGEEKTLIHKHNHLMANAWEFKNYLDQYLNFLNKLN